MRAVLLVLFQVGPDTYAVDARRVTEVVPAVALRSVPAAPPWVAGLLGYRGAVVPVVDLSRILGGVDSVPRLSTRILITTVSDDRGKERLLGLMAESVLETLSRDVTEFRQEGVVPRDAAFLGRISCDDRGMVQLVEIEKLVPAALAPMLFPEAS
ncbi:MAG: purine-binding chemotaxis protein CheW [Candidatus Riflebacteria bacterium]|nr:purine-binding chemotaxis protein CheW [Candidatus Riflebacteria bacterium]